MCFRRQSYQNRELVVVSNGTPEYQHEIQSIVAESGEPRVRLVFVNVSHSLSHLRNLALDAASGPLVCQWDDDDLYHPERLQVQIEHMLSNGSEISYLTDQFHVFWDRLRLYWVDWSSWEIGSGVTPNSLLGLKAALPHYVEGLARHEDTLILRRMLANGVRIARLKRQGYLYIYSYDGTNVFSQEHHLSIVKEFALSAAEVRRREHTVRTELARYAITPSLEVMGSEDEVAFTCP